MRKIRQLCMSAITVSPTTDGGSSMGRRGSDATVGDGAGQEAEAAVLELGARWSDPSLWSLSAAIVSRTRLS